jgi:dTDP-glucose 4,6-dehydratase
VGDNVEAIFKILDSNCKNDIFNIAAENYLTNLEVVNSVIEWIGTGSYTFVENRKGQDLRYAINCEKIKKLGWVPEKDKGLYKWKEF